VRLLDPCVKGGKGCPSGITGTVLANERESLHVLEATADVTPARFSIYDQCVRDQVRPDASTAVLAIISNHPATFTMSGLYSGTARTSARQRSRWQAARDRGADRDVVTCAALNPVGRHGSIHVEGRDDLGATDRLDTVIDVKPLDRKRPPVSVVPTGDLALQVSAPVRDSEYVQVWAVTRNSPAAGASRCGGTEDHPDSLSRTRIVQIPPAVLTSGAYPYDPVWRWIDVVDVRLQGGSGPYELCVRWFHRQRSYDVPQLVDAQSFRVLPPTRNEVRIAIEGVFPGAGDLIDASRLSVAVKNADGAPPCAAGPGTAVFPLGPDKYAAPVALCGAHTGATGEWTSTTVRHGGGEIRSALRLSSRFCHTGSSAIRPCTGPFTEWYSLAIPKLTGGVGRGVVLLRLDYDVPGDRSMFSERDRFLVLPGIDVAVSATDIPEYTNPSPQVDTFATTFHAAPGVAGRSTLVLQWNANQPVTVSALVEQNDADTCSRDPRPQVDTTTPAATGTLEITHLCALTRTRIGVNIRTADGRTASYSDIPGRADRSGTGFTATTEGIPVTFSPAVVVHDPFGVEPTSVVRFVSAAVIINGGPVISSYPLTQLQRSLRQIQVGELPCFPLAGLRATNSNLPSYIAAGPQHALWGEDVHMTVWANIYVRPIACTGVDAHPADAYAANSHNFDFVAQTTGPYSVLAHPADDVGCDCHSPRPGLAVQLDAHAD
jgi:hypothetical protein